MSTVSGSRVPGQGTRLRVAGVVIAVLAILVHLNLAQMHDENELALRSTGVLTSSVDRVLADHRSEAVSSALEEYLMLVAAGFGATLALAGPRVYLLFLTRPT